VLHTYSSESRLGREGRARRLIYQWEAGPSADAKVDLPEGSVVVFVEALHAALVEGVQAFLIDSEMDSDTRRKVRHHIKSMLCYAPWPALEAVAAL
jgi:hypothetical protein